MLRSLQSHDSRAVRSSCLEIRHNTLLAIGVCICLLCTVLFSGFHPLYTYMQLIGPLGPQVRTQSSPQNDDIADDFSLHNLMALFTLPQLKWGYNRCLLGSPWKKAVVTRCKISSVPAHIWKNTREMLEEWRLLGCYASGLL
jgi:hypothetical protein